jgi:serine/threonine protein kinase
VEVTRAVNWLHSKHLIHGDITPHNILVKLTQTGSYQVKLLRFLSNQPAIPKNFLCRLIAGDKPIIFILVFVSNYLDDFLHNENPQETILNVCPLAILDCLLLFDIEDSNYPD